MVKNGDCGNQAKMNDYLYKLLTQITYTDYLYRLLIQIYLYQLLIRIWQGWLTTYTHLISMTNNLYKSAKGNF